MSTVSDIIQHVETLSGHPLNQDEGVHHGAKTERCSAPSSAGWPRPTPFRRRTSRMLI